MSVFVVIYVLLYANKSCIFAHDITYITTNMQILQNVFSYYRMCSLTIEWHNIYNDKYANIAYKITYITTA